MAIKDALGGISWSEWPAELKDREEAALNQKREELAGEVAFYKFQQFMFLKPVSYTHLMFSSSTESNRTVPSVSIRVTRLAVILPAGLSLSLIHISGADDPALL